MSLITYNQESIKEVQNFIKETVIPDDLVTEDQLTSIFTPLSCGLCVEIAEKTGTLNGMLETLTDTVETLVEVIGTEPNLSEHEGSGIKKAIYNHQLAIEELKEEIGEDQTVPGLKQQIHDNSVDITNINERVQVLESGGVQGEKGEQGEKGDQGPQGEQGLQGEPAVIDFERMFPVNCIVTTRTGFTPNELYGIVPPMNWNNLGSYTINPSSVTFFARLPSTSGGSDIPSGDIIPEL
jgi:hypothetical protein